MHLTINLFRPFILSIHFLGLCFSKQTYLPCPVLLTSNLPSPALLTSTLLKSVLTTSHLLRSVLLLPDLRRPVHLMSNPPRLVSLTSNQSELLTLTRPSPRLFCSGRARELIRWILQGDPKDRPTLMEILAHPFFATGDNADAVQNDDEASIWQLIETFPF